MIKNSTPKKNKVPIEIDKDEMQVHKPKLKK